MGESLQVEMEVRRIHEIARRDLRAAREALSALLDRPKRLRGMEFVEALDFNARLVSALRLRGTPLYGDKP